MIRLDSYNAPGYAIDMFINGQAGMCACSHSSVLNCRDRPAFIDIGDDFSCLNRLNMRLRDKALGTCFNVCKPVICIDNARRRPIE